MRAIPYQLIVQTVAALCGKATTTLPRDVQAALAAAHSAETSPLGKTFLSQCLDNARIAAADKIPICQDTGLAVFFVEIGSQISIIGGELVAAINEGTAAGYTRHFLRKSVVDDPLYDRVNTKDNTPAFIHLEIVEGDTFAITFAPKGGGSENMSRIAMLSPGDGEAGIIDFVVKAVVQAGANPCPPVVVGVGIGGTFEKCATLSKKALLRTIGESHPDERYARLEKLLLEKINASGVGPQGLGGDTTALAVHIETLPCHIASLPVAVNLNCHAARHIRAEL